MRDELGFLVPAESAAQNIANKLIARGTLLQFRHHEQASGPLDAAAVRKAVMNLREKGLIHRGTKIVKNGAEAAQHDGVISQWMEITPAVAKAWLENNFANRPLTRDTVKAYALDMKNGKWLRTHQGIAFNDLDELIDGQHRLSAVVSAGVPVVMMVTFGLPAKTGEGLTTMDCVDRGKPRSVSDQLKIQHGMKDAPLVAAITAAIAMLCNDERTRRLSVAQTLEIYSLFESAIHFVIKHRSNLPGLKTRGFLGAFAFAIAADDNVEDAYVPTIDGTLATKDPLWHLRQFLTGPDAVMLTRNTDRGVGELVLQALLLQSAGKSIAKLELSQDGLMHFRSLQAERVSKVARMFALEAVSAS